MLKTTKNVNLKISTEKYSVDIIWRWIVISSTINDMDNFA